ncbi:odorant receptor 131-2-like [Anomaloglossus baeobatrachus]|uniref:odorant receptor 131-2-like n=1 Tax=Anomaloglossus baeobatrachus TaxID=238106 RepID=UPI003F507E35
MVNSTEVSNTMSKDTIEIVTSVLYTFIFMSFGVFLCFGSIILYVFFTSPHIQENARYVLFIHMLLNDTLMLFVITFLSVMAYQSILIPMPICYAFFTCAASAFRVTSYNLAIMSLERYFAICHPLRHAELCNVHMSFWAIGVMWILGLTPQFLDFIVLCYSMPKGFFSISLKCRSANFTFNSFQGIIRSVAENSTMVLVALVILYTYVRVMVVARKIGSGKSSAFKAEKTVLLHALQLGLSMMSFTSAFTNVYFTKYFFFLPITNHFFFLHIPRIISPLIYGLRDEVFWKYMRKIKFCA